jgi:putative heme-binding domain-containing protein
MTDCSSSPHRRGTCAAGVVVGAVFLLASSLTAQVANRPPATAELIEQGRQIYVSQCGGCHGLDGSGGRGPSLARPRLLHAPDDDALYSVIQRGIPGTEMPSSWFSSGQIWAVASYVRTLGRVAAEPVSGDAARGREIYFSKGGCAQCHSIAGHGGGVGPDLDDIGARRSVSHLRQALREPEAFIPARFVQVRLVTRDGRAITGVRVNEDSFSIQVRDLANVVHSFWKDELREVEKEWGRSPMPAYQSLSAREIDDLVAYLASFQGGA